MQHCRYILTPFLPTVTEGLPTALVYLISRYHNCKAPEPSLLPSCFSAVWIPALQHHSPLKGPGLRSFVMAGQSLGANGYIASTSAYRENAEETERQFTPVKS